MKTYLALLDFLWPIAAGSALGWLWMELRRARRHIERLDGQHAQLLAECDRVDWISSCQVREILGDDQCKAGVDDK